VQRPRSTLHSRRSSLHHRRSPLHKRRSTPSQPTLTPPSAAVGARAARCWGGIWRLSLRSVRDEGGRGAGGISRTSSRAVSAFPVPVNSGAFARRRRGVDGPKWGVL
jgi:hypothetical protein